MKKKPILFISIIVVILIIVAILGIFVYKKYIFKEDVGKYLYEEDMEYIKKNEIIQYEFVLLKEGYTCYTKKVNFYNNKSNIIYIRYLQHENKGPIKNTIKVELGNINELNIQENIEKFNNYCKNVLNYSEELNSSVYFYNKSNDKDMYENLKNGEILLYNNFDNNQKIYQIAYYKQGDKLIGEFSYCGITTKNEEVVDEGIGEH